MRCFTRCFKKKYLNATMAAAIMGGAGAAVADHTTLTNNAGWRYYFDPSESELFDIDNNGLGLTDIADGSFRLFINGIAFNGDSNATVLDGEGRLSGIDSLSGLDITRETYVPINANFMRQVTTLTNSTGAAIVVTVGMDSNEVDATVAANVTVPASSSGNATFGTDDVWMTINSGDATDAVMAHAFGSTGAAETIDAVTAIVGSSTFSYEWQNISVPAGGTVMFLAFTSGEVDNTAAEAAASSLSSFGDFAKQLNGINSADYNKIINFSFADGDGDGMIDAYETVNGLNPAVNDAAADLDGDGLNNLAEFTAGTDPTNTDSDNDSISDGDEVNTYSTNPLLADTDGDGISDGDEVATFGADPLDSSDGSILPLSSGVNPTHSPEVAVDSLGRMHAVWMEEVEDTNTMVTAYNVMYKMLDSEGATLIDTTQLSDSGADGDSNQGHPSITVDSNNHVYVYWFSRNTDDGNGFFIGLDPANAALDGSASTVAALQKFATVGVDDCKRGDMAVDSIGNIHIACSDGQNNVAAMSVFAADGTVVTAPYEVTGSISYGCCGPDRISLALDASDRGVIAMYHSGNEEVAYAMVDGVAGTTLTASTDLTTGSSDSQRQVSISLDAAGVAYMVWGDRANGAQFASFTPSLDDLNGDAAVPASIGFGQSGLGGVAGQWYISAALGSDNQMMIAYNTASTGNNDGGKSATAPRYFTKLSAAGVVVTSQTVINPNGGSSISDTRANFIGIAEQDTNLVTFISGSPSTVRLARADGTRYVVLPEEPKKKKKGSSAASLWTLLGLSGLVGLLRLRRKS